MKKLLFVVGALDPEMTEIIAKVSHFNCTKGGDRDVYGRVVQASQNGFPVKPPTAYQADGIVALNSLDRMALPEADEIITIECQVEGVTPDVVIDHHRPGDPGYGKGPADYWEASSLGQLCRYLGLEPTERDRLVAAADHCLGHAYQGKCPGVDPEPLRAYREKSRAGYQKIDVTEIRKRVDAAIETLETLPASEIGGQIVVDGTGGDPIPEAPEAVAMTGKALMYSMPCKVTGREKVGLIGGMPEATESWMNVAHKLGLADIYGDPARGFAGGYR